jgi:hypothetical protein
MKSVLSTNIWRGILKKNCLDGHPPAPILFSQEGDRTMKLLKGLLYAVLIILTGGIAAVAVMFWYRLKEDEKEAT